MACFAANLTSILTIKNLESEIISGNVGYQSGSFVLELLKDLGYDDRKIVSLSTAKEYADALRSGRVSAIYDELPYIKVFLAEYCSEFRVTGPTYPTGGFGFVCLFLSLQFMKLVIT